MKDTNVVFYLQGRFATKNREKLSLFQNLLKFPFVEAAMQNYLRYSIFIFIAYFFTGCGQASFIQGRQQVQEGLITEKKEQLSIEPLLDIPDITDFQNKLFVLLNAGTIYFYSQQFDSCIEYLNLAEEQIQEQYTRRVSQEIGSIFSNDYSVNYMSYPVEHLLVHFYKSLAFLGKNNVEGAWVEVKKLQEKLDYLQDYPGFYKFTADDYKFLNYYCGLVGQKNNDENFARVCYTRAGLDSDQMLESNKNNPKINIQLLGLVPEIYEAYLRVLVQTDKDIHHLKIAYPILFDTYQSPSIGLDSRDWSFSVTDQFTKEFNQREEELEPKMVSRVVTKFLISEGAVLASDMALEQRKKDREKKNEEKRKNGEKEDNSTDNMDTFWTIVGVFGQVMKVVNDVSEKADLRQWFLLPDYIVISTTNNNQKSNNAVIHLIDNNDVLVDYWAPKKVKRFNPNEYQRTINFNSSNENNRNDTRVKRRRD